MEDDEIMKMVEDAFCHCYFIIGVIIGDDKITMQAVLKDPSIDDQGQVQN